MFFPLQLISTMGLGVGVPSLLGSSCGASAARRRRGLKTQAEFLEDSSRVTEKIASIKSIGQASGA